MNYCEFNQYAGGASLKWFLLLSLWIKAQRLATFMPTKLGSGKPPHIVQFLILTDSAFPIRETYAPDIDSNQFPPAQHV